MEPKCYITTVEILVKMISLFILILLLLYAIIYSLKLKITVNHNS